MKKYTMGTLLTGLSVLALVAGSAQAATYNSSLAGGYTAQQLVDIIVPVASGINVVTVGPLAPTFNGATGANTGNNTSNVTSPTTWVGNGTGGTVVGSFAGGDSGFVAPGTGGLGIPFQSGLVLSSGYINGSKTPNDQDLKSNELGTTPGNSLLEASSLVVNGPNLPNGTTLDAAVLQFSFTVANHGIFQFQYAFASDEYSEFVPPSHPANDAFAFVLSSNVDPTKRNLATIGSMPISVKTVNNGYFDGDNNINYPATNPGFFTDNAIGSGNYALEYDGIAGGSGDANGNLYAMAEVFPGITYTLALVIGDGGSDRRGDSAVYIAQNSASIIPPPPPTVPEPSTYVGGLALAGLVARRLRRK